MKVKQSISMTWGDNYIFVEVEGPDDLAILDEVMRRVRKTAGCDPEQDCPPCLGNRPVCETCNNDYSKCVGGKNFAQETQA